MRTKRILSLLLAAVMVLTLLPVGALAEEEIIPEEEMLLEEPAEAADEEPMEEPAIEEEPAEEPNLDGAGETPITALAFTVAAPAADAAIPGDGDSITGETDQYTYECSWYIGKDPSTWAYGTFEKGKDYCVLFQVYPKSGYTLEGLNRDNITINGNAVNNYAAYQPSGSYYRIDHTYTLTPEEVAVPAGAALTYTGKQQTGVKSANTAVYTVSGNTGTNAGAYTATAALKDKTNYTWSDGTTADKKIPWTITPKPVTPTVTLSATSFTYNGKAQKPAVTVKVGGTKLAASEYSVSYASGRKNVGKYAVKVTLKGNYTGAKTVYFKINPKAVKITSAKSGATRKLTVKWSKNSTVTGYQIQYSTSKTFASGKKAVKAKGPKLVTKTLTGLKSGRVYYVRVRTYKIVSGATYYSAWSSAVKVKTK